ARYVYADSPVLKRTGRNARQTLTPKALGTLPPELFTKLEQAAVQGDTDKAERLLTAIRSYDAAVADALAVLVADFEYADILELLKKGREDKQ
ncbi:MAG: hypothetical protein GY850_40425, partial [bacterium]|nr:hypothetical protein [bacterium]